MALVELAAFSDRIAAEIARGHLEAQGIHAVIFDAGISSLGLGGMAPARLMVDGEDREAAARLLSEADEGAAD